MTDSDYAPVTSLDEEEEERRRLAAAYPPVSATGTSPGIPKNAAFAPFADPIPSPSDRQPNELYPAVSQRTSGAGADLYPVPSPAGKTGALSAAPPNSTPNINDEMESGASKLRMMNVATLRSATAAPPAAPAVARPQWKDYAPAEKHGW